MPVELSRRAALTSALAGAAAVGVAAARGSDAATTALPRTSDPALHAARRLTYGATPEVVARIRELGLAGWVDEQLKDVPDLHGELAALGTTSLPLPSAVLMAARPQAVTDLQAATFARAAWGDRQLYELLVETFTNHLSVSVEDDAVGVLKVADDRDVVRAHVLGTFSDMLVASVQSPAMLTYLTNCWSHKPWPNENYARELLELHTVGATSGYRQRDVHNAALALTGLSVDESTGAFTYRTEWHHVGPVRVMGWSHPNRDQSKGQDVALSLVSYLAHHPMTARRIATKLVRRLVSDTPPAGLVASAARVYLASGTQVVPVVKHIISSSEFQSAIGQKSQRPFEWFVQCVRALGLRPSPDLAFNGAAIVSALRALGQAPFEWSPPNGYPDNANAYASTATMLARWNAGQALVQGGVGGLSKPDAASLLGSPAPTTAGAVVDRLSRVLLGSAPRAGLTRAVLTGVGLSASHVVDASAAQGLVGPMAALLLSSPEALVR